MQLHRLTLCAIGPFPGEHTIDFDRLGASGLFLLEGPTGAGKSSVIDAVVFALYGKVAGDQSSDERMRSDFAAPATTPFAELVFSTSAGLYCVRRTPKFERPKQRGAGTTTQHATATLWRLTSPDAPLGEPLTTRMDETSAQVQDIVGLSRDQFVQTMVLPQGEFASFLRAGAEERRTLLQRLFGTEVYDRVQRELEDRRREANAERGRARGRVREQVAAFCGAAGLADDAREELLGLVEEPEGLLAVCEARVTALADTATAATAQATAQGEAARLLAAELAQAVEVRGRAERKASLLARQDQLSAGESEVQTARTLLGAAERAERVRPVLEAHDRATAEQQAAHERCARLAAVLPAPLASAAVDTWRTAHDELDSLVAEISPHLADEAEHEARTREVAALAAQQERAGVARDAAVAALAAHPQLVREAREEHEQLRALVAGLPQALASRDAAAARSAAATRAAELRRRLAAAEEELADATVAVRLASEREHELRTRYLDGLAGELARALVVGEPCTVCGSTAHPRPAAVGTGAVERADVDRAEAERREAMKHHDVLAQGVADLRAQADLAGTQSQGLPPSVADAALHDAQDELARHEAAAQREPELVERLTGLQQQERRLREAVTTATAAAERATGEHRAAQRELRRSAAQLQRWRGGHRDVAGHLEELRQRLAPLDAVLKAAADAAGTDEQVQRCVADVVRWSSEQGFGDGEEARTALLDPKTAASLAVLVREYDEARAAVAAGLADPVLADVEPVADHDLGPLQRQADDAAALAAAALEKAATSQQRAREAARAAGAVEHAAQEAADGLARTAPVLRLADLVTASTPDNVRSMTLATYVVIERFRDVVAAANDRLASMSEGRYSLQHVEDRSGNRRAGLGLTVVDQHTGQDRDPGTLSGGETFYCSLALALGLADVVTSESGGIALGTLFVDEGFGSLDPETLEHVLEVLGRLRAGGRVVGVVSHVPELKERISERIMVSRTVDGSSRLAVVA